MSLHEGPISIHSAHLLLKKYMITKDLTSGRKLYSIITKTGLQTNTFLGSHFIRLFSFSESSHEAELVFSRLVEPNVFSYTAMISAFNEHGEGEKSMLMYRRMLEACIRQDEYVRVGSLNSCAMTSTLFLGKQIHVQIQETSAESDVFVCNALIDMYSKCGDFDGALTMFRRMSSPDLISWNAIIGACTQNGLNGKALCFFCDMQNTSFRPSPVTLVNVLKACTNAEFSDTGRVIHALVVEEGFEPGTIMGSALTNMYAKCGELTDASCVLERQPNRHIGIWNALITGYTQHGNGEKALLLFQKMNNNGFAPNEVTFVCILKACTGMASFNDGKQVHVLIIDNGLEQDSFITSSLIDMYTAFGSLNDARRVFDMILKPNELSWSSLVIGYSQHGCSKEALHLFQQMQLQGAKADLFTFVYILKACTDIIALEEGLLVHYIIIERGIELDSCLGSTLIDFHAKCSSIKDATNVFVHLPKQNVVTWSAMISGYTLHGNHEAALQSFTDMKHLGMKPDDVMFISLLSTCAQMGLVDEGKDLFDVMTNEFGLVPSGEHYNCLVDLLGRVGRLTEAEALMELAPAESSFVGWMTLLSHCRAHGRVAMAKRCFEHIVALDCGHGSAYVLMSEIYTGAGMWDDAERIGKMKNFSQAWKKPGQASVEVNKKVHTFVVGDRTHPQKEGVYSKLNHLNFHLLMAGYEHRALKSDALEGSTKGC